MGLVPTQPGTFLLHLLPANSGLGLLHWLAVDLGAQQHPLEQSGSSETCLAVTGKGRRGIRPAQGLRAPSPASWGALSGGSPVGSS